MKNVCAFAAMVAAMVCAYVSCAADPWNVRTNVTEDVDANFSIAKSADVVVRQSDWSVLINTNPPPAGSDVSFGAESIYSAAYLLDGGALTVNVPNWCLYGAYHHIRQTGGDFSAKYIIYRKGSPMRADFVFGGDGTANIGFESAPSVLSDATFAFRDSIFFGTERDLYKYINIGVTNNYIFAHDGGIAEYSIGSSATNIFFAFDGGTRGIRGAGRDNYWRAFGYKPQIRVYEGGAEFNVMNGDVLSIKGYDFRSPSGNVVKSITLTPAAMSNIVDGVARFWDFPPQVEISDATGNGNGAAAVVDYDFDNRIVTNITVLSCGEKYSGSPTAQFRMYDRELGGVKDLLETPLVCEVATGVNAGEITFSSTNLGARVEIGAPTAGENMTSTNYCSSLVIDMDRLGLADGGKTISLCDNAVVLYFKNAKLPVPAFPNLTNITVRSGAIQISSSYGYKHDASYGFLPKCYSLQLYGGHIGGGSCIMSNVVVGGTVWLTGHNISSGAKWAIDGESSPYHSDINLTTGTFSGWTGYTVPTLPGTMVVDVDSPYGPAVLKGGIGTFTYNNVINRGNVRFGGSVSNPSKMTIKNYESLKSSARRRILLDLSDPNLGVWGTNNVAAVTPPDLASVGRLKWSAIDRKLYWQPYIGTIFIFR